MNPRNIKKIAASILFLMLFTNFFSFQASSFPPNDFPFHQEISLPGISDDMLYQPVDMDIQFIHSCWAENENIHSIRVVYDDGSEIKEIESQAYNFHYTDGEHIDSCDLVFLLQGKGKYYVYYSGKKTSGPDYVDHVQVSDDSYYYEPIPGYHINLNYYRVVEDGYCIYGIGQEGSFFGIDMSQKVIKQIDGKKEFKAFNWGQLASFAMFWYEGSDKGTDEKLLSKNIIVDGNLMARVGIISTSSDGKMKTTAFYTCYYSPSKEKRLMAEVKHEALEECRVYGMEEDDGLYVYLLTVRCRSSSIQELNLGYIPPYLHINAEDGTVHEYMLDQNPENEDYNWLLSAKDDIDLGLNPWFSIDDGTSGKAYAIIFKNNSVVSINHGIQVTATECQEVNIPGLEVDGGGVSGGRNSYEAGGTHDLVMPKGFVAKFTAEFFSSPDGGLQSVKKEADIFHKLIPYRACATGTVEGGRAERYSLVVFTHFAPSMPFSPALSVLTGKKLPTLTAELWRNGTVVSSGVLSRLPFTSTVDGKPIFDWKNFTIIKKVVFPSVPPGKYVVKIFRGMGSKKYVGAGIVDINGDSTIHILCGFEGKVRLNVFDQEGEGIKGVDISLERDGEIYSSNLTDGKGAAVLNAPAPSKYALKAFYKGFLIHEENIRLPTFFDRKIEVEINDLKVIVRDALGFPPGVAITPVLTSNSMERKLLICGEEVSPGQYLFRDLPSASYTLQIRYKSFSISRDCSVPDERKIDVLFPAVYSLKIKPFDSRGMEIKDVDVVMKRDGKDVDERFIPPGNYAVTLMYGGRVIGKRNVFVTEDTAINMVTTKSPCFPAILSAAIAVSAAVFLAIFIKKLSLSQIFMILSVAVLILSTIYPWWHMAGEGEGMKISTNVFLVPAKMVTIGRADNFINGEVAAMPSLFGTMLSMVLAVSVFAVIVAIISFLMEQKWVHIIAIASIIAAILIFSYGMSQVAEVTTGSFWGSGNMGISIPGSSEKVIECKWSPASGYCLSIVSLLLLIVSLFFKVKPMVIHR
ncbi:MAG: hypothetical protein U9O96_04270 [Candidatus Thermoplasmatota archaeon]|nr:hypothetical protein [Candidatus Thermoplasmatota archaeon]